jgi:hypothetical protein
VRPETMRLQQQIMHEHNPNVLYFNMTEELIVGGDDESSIRPCKRDIETVSFNPLRINLNNQVPQKVSVMQYYSSRLMVCSDLNSDVPRNLISFGRLFHQYIVNQYVKMEQQRLNFIRFNQETLRAELYNGLADVLRLDDTDMGTIAQKVIHPSSFVGGPRYMAQLYQDAMNMVRRFGKPNLFITFTCNPT